MKKLQTLSLVLTFCFAQSALSAVTPLERDSNKLYLIKKIFIEIRNIVEAEKIELYLKQELERRGFMVIDDTANADAILSIETMGEVTLDEDGSTPPRIIYQYYLSLPNKENLWKGQIKFVPKKILAESHLRATRKITERFANAWKKSAKKAGITRMELTYEALSNRGDSRDRLGRCTAGA